jgi:hypothetical protein
LEFSNSKVKVAVLTPLRFMTEFGAVLAAFESIGSRHAFQLNLGRGCPRRVLNHIIGIRTQLIQDRVSHSRLHLRDRFLHSIIYGVRENLPNFSAPVAC